MSEYKYALYCWVCTETLEKLKSYLFRKNRRNTKVEGFPMFHVVSDKLPGAFADDIINECDFTNDDKAFIAECIDGISGHSACDIYIQNRMQTYPKTERDMLTTTRCN